MSVEEINKDTPRGDRNGEIQIHISEDQLRVYLDFFPPQGKGKPLTAEQVEVLLKEENLTRGIDWHQINKSLFASTTEQKVQTNVLVAQGKPPVKERPGYFRIEKKLFTDPLDTSETKGSVDYKEVHSYRIVKKGEVLASLIKKRPGEKGVDVLGNEIPFEKKEVVHLKPGKNTYFKEGYVKSRINGRYQSDRSHFWVEEVLEIDEGVDYKTGHIFFPGDIHIRGHVQDGFRIISGGNITCEATLDATEVLCKKNLEVKSGIIGRQKGILRIGGDLLCDFIENCHVEVKGNIYVKKGIMNSEVFSQKDIILPKGGSIVSSIVQAKGTIECEKIDHPGSNPSKLYLGLDFVQERKLAQTKKQLEENESTIKRYTDALESHPQMKETLDKLVEAHQKLLEEFNEENLALFNNEASLKVHGTVQPGLHVVMEREEYHFDKESSAFVLVLENRKFQKKPLK